MSTRSVRGVIHCRCANPTNTVKYIPLSVFFSKRGSLLHLLYIQSYAELQIS